MLPCLLALTLTLTQAPTAAPISPDPPQTVPPSSSTDKQPRVNTGTLGLVSGRVAVAGEGALPDRALVEVACPGQPPRSTLTGGGFDLPLVVSSAQSSNTTGSCEIVVSLSGYLPLRQAVNASGHTRLGLLLLQPRPGVRGFSYSATSLMAPAPARQAFDRGMAALAKRKTAAAVDAFSRAVELHPQYAAAWLQLGAARQTQGNAASARTAFEQALACDAKFLPPMLHLAALAAGERDWKKSADWSDRLIALNPVEFPEAYIYNAVAFYNLGHAQPAEQAVLRAIELDMHHRYPKGHQLLGVLLADRQDLTGAAEQFRLFLKYAPKSPDAATVRQRLAELEKKR